MQIYHSGPKFGKQFREDNFSFRPGYVPINNGSFGMAPKCVTRKRVEELEQVQACQDIFYKDTVFKRIEDSRKIVANWLDAEKNSIVFATNATSGLNTVLRSYPLTKGDRIVYPSMIYGAIGKTLLFLQNRYGVEPVEVKIGYPMTNDEIVQAYIDAIEREGGASTVKMGVMDAVVSNPGVRMPWERLCHELRQRGILSVVDGAHGMGLIDISINQAQPDFFVTNLHKWFYLPPSCAALYVAKEHHHKIHTMPVSHSYLDDDYYGDSEGEERRLIDRFTYTGCVDPSVMLSIPRAEKFIQEECGGIENLTRYREDLALEAGRLAAKHWGTEIMELDKLGQHTAMVNIRLPMGDVPKEDHDLACRAMTQYMLEQLNVFGPLFPYNGQIWTRWSAQSYTDLDDFKYGIDAFDKAMQMYRTTPRNELPPGFKN